jgi:acyl-CoA reductase-like NAD-dependent aldehyde dehydrogenase
MTVCDLLRPTSINVNRTATTDERCRRVARPGALAATFDADTQMGPLAVERRRDRVEGYIAGRLRSSTVGHIP